MSDVKLLPCPFCGGEVKYFRPSHHIEHFVNHHTIYCEHCDFRMEGVSALQLMDRWNTRKPMERIVEQLEADERHTFDGCINKRYAIETVKEGGIDASM